MLAQKPNLESPTTIADIPKENPDWFVRDSHNGANCNTHMTWVGFHPKKKTANKPRFWLTAHSLYHPAILLVFQLRSEG